MLSLFWLNSTIWFRFKLARFYEQKGCQDKATKIYEKILRFSDIEKRNPFIPFFKNRLSQEDKFILNKRLCGYFVDSGYRDRAIKCYKVLEEYRPQDVENYLNLYVINHDAGRLVDIILGSEGKNLEDKLPPKYLESPLWRYHYGLGLIKRGRYRQAKNIFFKLVTEYPYLSTFHYCLGYAFQNLNLIDRAEEEYKITCKLNPDYIPSLNNLRIKGFSPTFDLIGIWHFDEAKGDIFKDISGRDSKGIIEGAKWTEGVRGYALEFDGVDDTAVIPKDEGLSLDAGSFTITVLVKPTLQGKNYFVYRKGLIHFCLNDKNGSWMFKVRDSKRPRPLVISRPVENKWYFIVQRFIQNKEHKVWLFDSQGLLESAERRAVGSATYSDGYDFQLSRRGRFENDITYFKGKIDEVMIFSRSLTDNEIMDLYKSLNISVVSIDK